MTWDVDQALDKCGKGTAWYGKMIREQLELTYKAGYEQAKKEDSAPRREQS